MEHVSCVEHHELDRGTCRCATMLPTLHMVIRSVRQGLQLPVLQSAATAAEQRQLGVCLSHQAPVFAVGARLQRIECPAEVPQRQHSEHQVTKRQDASRDLGSFGLASSADKLCCRTVCACSERGNPSAKRMVSTAVGTRQRMTSIT